MPSRPAKKQRPAKPADPKAFFSQAEADAARAHEQSAGNPKIVLGAFTGTEAITVAGYTIPVIGLGRYMLLERIESPVLKGDFASMTNQQLCELIFAAIKPEPEIRALLAQGRPAFEDAVAAFSDGIPLGAITELGAAIGARIAYAHSTIISPGGGNGSQKKTAATSSPASPATASAGG